MRITEIKLRTVKQIQQFEPEEVTLTASPEGTNADECLAAMRATTASYFGLEVPVTEVVEVKKEEVKKEEVVKKSKIGN